MMKEMKEGDLIRFAALSSHEVLGLGIFMKTYKGSDWGRSSWWADVYWFKKGYCFQYPIEAFHGAAEYWSGDKWILVG
jgi:hypothetical protein